MRLRMPMRYTPQRAPYRLMPDKMPAAAIRHALP